MSLSSLTSASLRRSYWDDSPPFPSLEPQDTPARSRFSSLRSSSSRPSSSSSRSSINETAPRTSRAFAKSLRQRRESAAPALTKRMSFIDFGEPSSGGLLGSLKGRMQKKRSVPLLRSSSSATTSFDPSSSSPLRLQTSRFPFRRVQGEQNNEDAWPQISSDGSVSFKDERKQTLVPEEVIDGVGYGVRESRLSTVAEMEHCEDVDCSKAGYRALPLRKKAGTILHSYPRSEAPYVRSYNQVDLQNDAYFHLLLRRLNTTKSPSFREYLTPPDDVLDLGCGQGTWVQEAAAAWPNAKIVGFDLIDVVSDNLQSPTNVTWKRGNFVTYSLPFGSGSFDLVRLANLTEAVPQYRWEHLLVEIRRVLKPAGRVEVIDDEIIFPYHHSACKPSGPRFSRMDGSRGSRNSWSSSKSHLSNEISAERSNAADSSFHDFNVTANRESLESAPSLCRDGSPSEESSGYPDTPTDGAGGLATLLEEKRPGLSTQCTRPTSVLFAREIETIYKRMLEDIYHINISPWNFLEALLLRVFGPTGKVDLIKDFQLSLLSPDMHDLVTTTKHTDLNRKRSNKLLKPDHRGLGRVDKDKEVIDRVMISQGKSKALRVLGADDSGPASNPISTHASDDSEVYDEFATANLTTVRGRASSGISVLPFPASSRPSSSSSAASQTKGHNHPTGLFIFPDQFLETTPLELERYLCKHIDTLLSCKTALDDYVHSLKNEHGDAVVDEIEWHDMLWEYERLRRERFNLPNSGGQFDDGDDEVEAPLPGLKEPVQHPRKVIQSVATAINNQLHTRYASIGSDATEPMTQHSTLVRRIRVFEAYKIKPSLLL